jgi:hypothetical protein
MVRTSAQIDIVLFCMPCMRFRLRQSEEVALLQVGASEQSEAVLSGLPGSEVIVTI